MFRPTLRVLIPTTVVVIACGALLLRADQAPSDKTEVHGLIGQVTLHIKGDNNSYDLGLKEILVKSLGGRSFLVGTTTNGQRVWVPIDEVRQIREPRENVRPAAPAGGQ